MDQRIIGVLLFLYLVICGACLNYLKMDAGQHLNIGSTFQYFIAASIYVMSTVFILLIFLKVQKKVGGKFAIAVAILASGILILTGVYHSNKPNFTYLEALLRVEKMEGMTVSMAQRSLEINPNTGEQRYKISAKLNGQNVEISVNPYRNEWIFEDE